MKKEIDKAYLELDEKFSTGKANKKTAEQNALININFINGKQYIKYNTQKNIVEELPEDKKQYRETEVFNRIRPFRNTIISNIKDKIPVPQVLPNSQDDEDLDASKATNAVLNDVFEKQKIVKTLRKAARDTVDIGPAFIHIKWDPNAGQVLLSDVNKVLGDLAYMVTNEEKMEILKKVSKDGTLRNGDVVIEYVPMYEIYVGNPFIQEIEDQEWVIRAKAYDKEVAEKLFKKEFTETETVGSLTMQSSEDTERLTRNLGVLNAETQEDKVVIKEYFQKPNEDYPNGRYVLFGGGLILRDEELPYINGEYGTRTFPFVKIGLDTPGQFYSHPFIEDMKAIQRRYNNIRNRKYEYITKNVHGQLAIEEGSLTDDAKITNKPGDILWYKRGFRPPTTITSNGTGTLDVDSELMSLGNEFVETTGISTLSMTGAPDSSAIRGAGQMQMIMEADNSKISLIIESLSDAVIEMSKQIIRLYKQNLKPGEVRFSRYTKDLGTVVQWNKDMLAEDITIKNKSKLSTTDARRKEDVKMMLSMGLLNPENTLGPELTMKLLEEFNTGLSITDLPIKGQADYSKARRENVLISTQFIEIDADDIDNHNIHYDIHANFMKSDEFRKMVIANPQLDQVMRSHLSKHATIVQQQNIQAQAQAIAMQKK